MRGPLSETDCSSLDEWQQPSDSPSLAQMHTLITKINISVTEKVTDSG